MTTAAEITRFGECVAYRTTDPRRRGTLIRLFPGVVFLLLFVCMLAACGGGSSPKTAQTAPPPPPGPAAIPATFFSISDTGNFTAPTVNYGTLGHPVRGGWESIEPSKGSYDFTTFFDGYVDMAPLDPDGSNTALVILTLSKTPPWALSTTEAAASCTPSPANGTVGCTLPPDNIQDWKDFVTALVQHYNGTIKPHIKYYEIWNEADSGVYWIGTPAQLEILAAAAYPIIKQDSHSLVITPSMVGSAGPDFLTQYLQAGGNQYADIASYHGYIAPMTTLPPYPLPTVDCAPPCGGSIKTQMTAYRQVLDNNGMQGKPLFNTEGGFYNSTITDADTAAAWLAQYYVLQAGEFTNLNVQLVTWWLWGGPPVPGSPDNGPALSAVGVGYNQVYNWLVGATFSTPCSNAGSIWTCYITRSGGYQAEIIWDASQTCLAGVCTTLNQPVASTYIQYRDLAGDPATVISGQVAVGLKPIILEN